MDAKVFTAGGYIIQYGDGFLGYTDGKSARRQVSRLQDIPQENIRTVINTATGFQAAWTQKDYCRRTYPRRTPREDYRRRDIERHIEGMPKGYHIDSLCRAGIQRRTSNHGRES
jgi:hypothetical protein